MDISGGISNLLQNRLFLQYLSGAGGALAGGQPVAPALNQITQQNIGAQSQAALNKRYMGMISKMLSGEQIPEGGKVIHSEKGTDIKIPKGMGTLGGQGDSGFSTMPGSAQQGTINPFSPSQPGVSAADLAGLGPQDVSRALSGALNVEALKQQSIARSIKAREVDPLSKAFPIPHPEVGTMTLRQWNALPADEKEFAAYVQTAKKLGAPAEELTRRFFSSLEPTEREKITRAAMKDPTLMAAMKELSAAGATKISIGEKVAGKVAEKKALGKLKGQLYFSDPDWIDDVNEYIGGEDIQREVFMESQKESGNPELMKAGKIIKFIEDKISVGGAIQDVKLSEDGKTMTWTVRWKSGDVEDISYVVRP